MGCITLVLVNAFCVSADFTRMSSGGKLVIESPTGGILSITNVPSASGMPQAIGGVKDRIENRKRQSSMLLADTDLDALAAEPMGVRAISPDKSKADASHENRISTPPAASAAESSAVASTPPVADTPAPASAVASDTKPVASGSNKDSSSAGTFYTAVTSFPGEARSVTSADVTQPAAGTSSPEPENSPQKETEV